MRLLLILSMLQRYASSCAATSGATTTTTTSATITTSTTAATDTTTTTAGTDTTTTSSTTTTTSTTSGSCSSCTAGQITFSSAVPGTDQNIDAMMSAIMTDPVTGCVTINAICVAAAGQISFMQFNGREGGPLENMGMTQTVTAQLRCVNGAWFYDVREINEVNCSGAAP